MRQEQLDKCPIQRGVAYVGRSVGLMLTGRSELDAQ